MPGGPLLTSRAVPFAVRRLLFAASLAAASALAASAPAAAPPVAWCGTPSAVDRFPDEVSGFAWHVVYAIPSDGTDRFATIASGIATDLSANEFIGLGWAKFRAGRTLHCRLGGTSTGGDITPSQDNPNVILMVLGKSAPQPPAPSGDSYPPGCLIGSGG